MNYAETIHATNPCVTADTWVHTGDGPRQVRDLVGYRFRARVDGRDAETGPSGFFPTGRKPVLAVRTREGHCLRLTADHRVLTAGSRTRRRIGRAWKPAGDLATGDMIVLHDHRAAPSWPGPYSQEQGYLIGLLVGDGTLKADKAVLSVWKRRAAGNGGGNVDWVPDGADGVMAAALAAAKTLPHRADFAGWSPVRGRSEHRLSLAAVKALALDLGMAPGRKVLTPKIEAASSGFTIGFLRGFFDADGSVQGVQEKGVSIRLAQSDLERLQVVQRMLARLGIIATIYADRRPAQMRSLPDGKGGHRAYRTGAQHELVIANENVGRYAELIGFADTEKQAKLDFALANYRRRPNRERFLAVVDTVEPDGEEEVFDVRVPGVNAFDANGLYVHNCGEQPLPPYGACLLGSINLARLVREPFEPGAALDLEDLRALTAVAVRMMDNVTDISNFPLEEQRAEALAKRRIGLGVTGLADALIMCRARYGSAEAVRLAGQWLAAVQKAAYLASADLAAEKGAFPLFDAEKYLATPAMADADEEVRAAIREKGLRNALLTSIAPTGTISLLADNVSSGVEPVFTWSYTRNVLMPDGTRREEEVADHAWRLYRRLKGADAPLPDWFVDAGDLSPRDHVVMQAAVQKHVDSSISKTINCPEDISFDAFKDVYQMAFDMGCKGCTTYRPNDVTGAVLNAGRREADTSGQQELPLAPPREDRGGEAGGRSGRRRGRLHDQAARPARGPARPDLQDPLAGERPRHLHHAQRHRAGRPPPALRDLHQLEEYRALRLDGRADAHDQRRVPARRRRLLRGRGAEGGVRSARRPVGRPALRPQPARRHRRRDRAAHDRHRLPARSAGGAGRPAGAEGRRRHGGGGGRRRGCGRERRGAGGRRNGRRAGVGKRRPGHARLPEMRPARPDPPGRLRHLHRLHLQQVRVKAAQSGLRRRPGISQDANRSGSTRGVGEGFKRSPTISPERLVRRRPPPHANPICWYDSATFSRPTAKAAVRRSSIPSVSRIRSRIAP